MLTESGETWRQQQGEERLKARQAACSRALEDHRTKGCHHHRQTMEAQGFSQAICPAWKAGDWARLASKTLFTSIHPPPGEPRCCSSRPTHTAHRFNGCVIEWGPETNVYHTRHFAACWLIAGLDHDGRLLATCHLTEDSPLIRPQRHHWLQPWGPSSISLDGSLYRAVNKLLKRSRIWYWQTASCWFVVTHL